MPDEMPAEPTVDDAVRERILQAAQERGGQLALDRGVIRDRF